MQALSEKYVNHQWIKKGTYSEAIEATEFCYHTLNLELVLSVKIETTEM